MITIAVAASSAEAEGLVASGYCPVGCAFAGGEVVDELGLLGAGAVVERAYQELHGIRAEDPRFVVLAADAATTFAVAALAGVLPKPADDGAVVADVSDLAATIAAIDSDPVGRDITAMPGGDVLLAWTLLAAPGSDELAAVGGVALWRSLTSAPASRIGAIVAAGASLEAARRQEAVEELGARAELIAGVLAIDEATVWGFDVWYGRREDADSSDPSGWENPVVVARSANGSITIGCPNISVAESLFGQGGLRNVLGRMPHQGWGGREIVGGSPRGIAMTRADLFAAAAVVASVRS